MNHLSLPVVFTTIKDTELTFAVARYIRGKDKPSPTEPPYASSEDRAFPLLKNVDYVVSHRAQTSATKEFYGVTIYPTEGETIQAFAETLPRAICFAALKRSGKVTVQ